MPLSRRLVMLVVLLLAAAALPLDAAAQNAVRGRALFFTTGAVKGNPALMSCIDCHSVASKTGRTAANINNAITGNVGGMGMFNNVLTLANGDLVDLAAYLANPAAVPNALPAISPGVLSFGNQAVGTQGAALTLTLSHDAASTAPFQLAASNAITLGGTNGADFRITGGTCANGQTLAVGANCTVTLAFAPSGAAGGRAGTVTLNFATTGVAAMTVIMSGNATATPTPTLSLSANALAFGSQQQGTTSAAQTVTLTNSGTAALSVTAITLGGAQAAEFTRAGTCAAGGSVAAGATCTLIASFTPAALGARAASIVVSSNNPGGDVSVALTGSGTTNVPVATITPAALNFTAQVGTTTVAQNVTVTNSGGGALTISAVSASNAVFPVSSGCTAPLAANASCTIAVRFTPSALGAASATLSIQHSAAMSAATVALNGTGNAVGAPVPSVNPSALAFSTLTAVGQQSAAQRVTLSNAGPGALTLGALASSAEFPLVAPATGACAANATLAQGASCFVDVRFAPAAAGARTGTLTLNSNGTPAALTVALTGSASAVAAPVIAYTPAGGPVFAPTSVGVAAATVTVTVSNVGSAPLMFGASPAAVDSTADGADFAVAATTCGGITLAPNQGTCTVTVRFTPVAGPAATRSATLQVTGNATALQVPLYGVVTNPGPAATPPAGSTPPSTGTPPGGSSASPAPAATAQNSGGGGALDGAGLVLLGAALVLARRRRHESWLQ